MTNNNEPTVDECYYYLKDICLFNGKSCNVPKNKMEQCQNEKDEN